jgi:predicted nucleic acid-binding protein
MSESLVHTAYFDSSALVKRYLTELGTAWVQTWCDDPGRTIAVAEIGLVEMASALTAKLRGGFITSEAYHNARADLLIDAQDEYVLVAVNRSLVDEAIELTAHHRLRGYDAVHLACALRLNRALTAHHLTPLTFVCADNDLLIAAEAVGLPTDNPNDHP